MADPTENASQSLQAASEIEGDENKPCLTDTPRFMARRPTMISVLLDALLIACSLAFLGFGGAILRLDGSDTDTRTSGYRNAITTLATILPILFAVIVGRLVSRIAQWKLEKGVKLGSLEQLMLSRTVGGSLLALVQLRLLNLLSLGILLTWAFSPLGAQSMLRMLDAQLGRTSSPSHVAHYDTGAQSLFATWTPVSRSDSALQAFNLTTLNSIYTTLLMTPDSIKADDLDLWGNVKIPYLVSYGEPNESGWQDVATTQHLEYSALAGVPITNISTGNTTFSLESSYIQFDCENVTVHAMTFEEDGQPIFPVETELNSSALCFSGPGYPGCGVVPNGTWQGYQLDNFTDEVGYASFNLALDTFIDPLWSNFSLHPDTPISALERPDLFTNETGIAAPAATLLFQARLRVDANTAPTLLSTTCAVTQQYVESRVRCSRTAAVARQNCSVIAQRPSLKAHAPETISQLSFPSVFRFISGQLPQATARNMMEPGLSLYYLNDPSISTLLATTFTGLYMPALEDVPPREFSIRLGQLMNSYLLLGQAFTSLLMGGGEVGVGSGSVALSPNVTVPVDVEQLVEQYVIHAGWGVVYMVSCVVLLFSAIASAVLAWVVRTPEILGYASTVVRNSRFVDVGPEADGLDGLELAQRMGRQRVRYGIVQQRVDGEGRQVRLGVGLKDEVQKIQRG
ncbi:hypothetical protein BDV06DRAFT_228336 [Aspergillus oleicola]